MTDWWKTRFPGHRMARLRLQAGEMHCRTCAVMCPGCVESIDVNREGPWVTDEELAASLSARESEGVPLERWLAWPDD